MATEYTPKPRARLIPERDPTLSKKIRNQRVYASLLALWETDIVSAGPKAAAIKAVVNLKDNSTWEIYQVWPKMRATSRVRDFLASLGDIFDMDGETIFFRYALVIALEPKTGRLIWIGATDETLTENGISAVVRALVKHVGVELANWGP